MFPQGWPGVALLLLRISVAAVLLISAANIGLSSSYPLFAGVSLISISLSFGFLTPFLSVIALAFAVANLMMGQHEGNLVHAFPIMPILDAAALALIGPGAYSVDARLFGRRVTVLSSPEGKNQG